MKYILIFIMLINILSVCKASLFSNALNAIPISCKFKNAAVNLSPFDIEDILSFLHSQRGLLQVLIDALSTVEATFVDSFLKASKNNEDTHFNITELIEKYGFAPEEHDVTTEDGYVLTMQRIVGDGPVIFLMHGLFASADDFVTPDPSKNLAFLLASEGYDVWLGNARGSKHSRKHVSLTPECEEFWEFSFHETGRYDLPAMIDHALATSGKTNLAYVGFSQGTTNFLVLSSELPEYNGKISLAALLAPVCFMSNLKSPLLRIAALDTNLIYKLGTLFGLNEVAPKNLLTDKLVNFFCGNNPLGKFICGSFIPLLSGFNTGLMDVQRLPVILSHLPAGGSLRQLGHYGQEILSGKFRKFDFKKSKNVQVYGSAEPPEYPLDEITAPVAVFYGENDWFANYTNVRELIDRLPNVVHTKFIEKYGHVDQLWASFYLNHALLSDSLVLINYTRVGNRSLSPLDEQCTIQCSISKHRH